jgi:hypothetical protein
VIKRRIFVVRPTFNSNPSPRAPRSWILDGSSSGACQIGRHENSRQCQIEALDRSIGEDPQVRRRRCSRTGTLAQRHTDVPGRVLAAAESSRIDHDPRVRPLKQCHNVTRTRWRTSSSAVNTKHAMHTFSLVRPHTSGNLFRRVGKGCILDRSHLVRQDLPVSVGEEPEQNTIRGATTPRLPPQSR